MIRPPVGARSAVILATSFTLLLVVSACSMATRTVDMTRLGPADQVQIYEGGKPVLDRPLAPGSKDERAVTSWLRSHADGWQPSLVTYAPGRRARGGNFDLNFHENRCVLNYRADDKGEWVQVVRPIRSEETIPDVFAPVQVETTTGSGNAAR